MLLARQLRERFGIERLARLRIMNSRVKLGIGADIGTVLRLEDFTVIVGASCGSRIRLDVQLHAAPQHIRLALGRQAYLQLSCLVRIERFFIPARDGLIVLF
ncbi:hypothetical protein D3C84_944910 [compost metagenome]